MANALGRIVRSLLWMAVLLLATVAVIALMRMAAVGGQERAALALVDVSPAEPTGRNGFAALMLSGHDVPAERREAVLAADVAAFDAWLAREAGQQAFWSHEGIDAPVTAENFSPLAGAGYPERLPAPPAEELCATNAPGCVASVRAREAAVAEMLHVHRDRLASLEDALAADHLVNPYAATVGTPLPPYGGLRLTLTAAALDAVQGRAPQAYARTCNLLGNARRMDRQGRNLIDKLVAQSLAEGAAWLLLDLRREFPVAALPAGCAEATAPVAIDEAMVCEAMRGEYRMQRGLIAQLDAQLGGWSPKGMLTRALLFDDDLQAAWSAREFAPYCSESTRTLADAGQPPPPPEPAVGFHRPACYAAYINCVLVQIASPAYIPYADRALDHAAKLRLLLAAQAVADGRLTADDAAAQASVAGYPVDFDPSTQRATITLRQPGGSEAAFQVELDGLAPTPRLTSLEGLARR